MKRLLSGVLALELMFSAALADLMLPAGLKEIEDEAFFRCTRLTSFLYSGF